MEKIVKIREDLGINQTELAVMLGCSRSNIAMAETGKRNLDLSSHERLDTLTDTIIAYRLATADHDSFASMGRNDIEKMLRAAHHNVEAYAIRFDNLLEKFKKIQSLLHYYTVVIAVEGDNVDVSFRHQHHTTVMASAKMREQLLKLHLDLIARKAIAAELNDLLLQYDDDQETDNIIYINIASPLQSIQ